MAHTEHFDTIYHDNTPHIEENGIANILPPELQGVDITPADLPKIQCNDEVAFERI